VGASTDALGKPEDPRPIRFTVLEVVKGKQAGAQIALAGRLVDVDDYNDRPVPYNFVRPSGRRGSCFTQDYRREAEHLLFLEDDAPGTYRVFGVPLSPVNEQLHGETDSWLEWVRREAKSGLPRPE